MRYDRFIDSIERVKAKYEAEIRKLLQEMAAEDTEVERVILKEKPVVSAASSAWTPARRAKQSRLMRKKMRLKYGEAKS